MSSAPSLFVGASSTGDGEQDAPTPYSRPNTEPHGGNNPFEIPDKPPVDQAMVVAAGLLIFSMSLAWTLAVVIVITWYLTSKHAAVKCQQGQIQLYNEMIDAYNAFTTTFACPRI